MQSHLMDTGELIIRIPPLKRPTLDELCDEYKDNHFKFIKRDISPIQAVTLRLGTVLRSGEPYIKSSECQDRISSYQNLIGFQQLKWILKNEAIFFGFKYLMTQIYIEGPGLIIVDDLDYECIPRLSSTFLHWTYVNAGSCSSFFNWGRIGYYQIESRKILNSLTNSSQCDNI